MVNHNLGGPWCTTAIDTQIHLYRTLSSWTVHIIIQNLPLFVSLSSLSLVVGLCHAAFLPRYDLLCSQPESTTVMHHCPSSPSMSPQTMYTFQSKSTAAPPRPFGDSASTVKSYFLSLQAQFRQPPLTTMRSSPFETSTAPDLTVTSKN
ncbi:hypothetical protein L195_g000905 [Trifolium pratense]|uniref:Uncharacterized protein n=1 Tax=Trifolium pratense TaxID=57577 RepID=A0A2K3NN67_TRIPR|nr:hypothetical protein L195_g000905 [Trifolium pratense]